MDSHKGLPVVLDYGVFSKTLLKLEFKKQTTVMSFADDLLIAVKAESVRESKTLQI